MKTKRILFLFIIPLCCFGERDYKMVDLGNGLTTELLAVGPTSLIIRVEWPLEIEINETVQFHLIGKLDIEKRGWLFLQDLTFFGSHGKVTFETPYSELSWGEVDEYKSIFQEKAWFAVRVSRAFYNKDNSLYSYGIRGMYEEDDEEEEIDEEYIRKLNEENWKLDEQGYIVFEEAKEDGVTESPPSREDELGTGNAQLEIEEQENPCRLWLYSVIVLFLCAVFYFVRKKFSKTP